MELLFWLFALPVLWCYAGYPALMVMRARFWPRPYRTVEGRSRVPPRVTVVIAVRDGARFVRRRVRNVFAQGYPAERLEVVIVPNGSTDGTEAVARELAAREPRVRVVASGVEGGKAAAINRGVASARGEIIVFADIRQTFGPGAIRSLVEPFGDPEVGAVTGRLVIAPSGQPVMEGVRAYWALETALRVAEGRTGSVVGATGAIYAIRRELFERLPGELILDDVWLPMRIVRRGSRVVFAPDAVAFDTPAEDRRLEYVRKRRTMVGNLQLLRLNPALLLPGRNPAFFRFVSHKVLRLATPVCLVGICVAALFLDGGLYRSALYGEVALLGLGVVGLTIRTRSLAIPAAFLLVHAAVFAAFFRFRHGASEIWAPSDVAPRGESEVASGLDGGTRGAEAHDVQDARAQRAESGRGGGGEAVGSPGGLG